MRLAPEDLGTASDKVKMLAMSALHVRDCEDRVKRCAST